MRRGANVAASGIKHGGAGNFPPLRGPVPRAFIGPQIAPRRSGTERSTVMRTGILLTILLAGAVRAQDTSAESDLATATRATIQKGFAFTLKPVVSMPDGFPQDRQALAGTTIVGEYSDGIYHARDGTYEIYKKGALTLVRTERGWLPMDQYTSLMRQDVAQAFDDRDGRLWSRGNVTAGRKALQQLIQLSHLNHRTNIGNLTRLEESILDPKQIRGATLNGKPAV